jgi:hypothetical protein
MTTNNAKRPSLIMAKTQDGVAWALYDDDVRHDGKLIAFKTGFATRPEAQRDGEIFYHMLMEASND